MIRLNLLKNIFLVFTAVIILIPTAVNFAHIFSGHGHEICEHYAEEHFHVKNLECELHQFQKNSALSIKFFEFTPEIPVPEKQKLPDYYQFLSDYIKLPFELRGPPLS